MKTLLMMVATAVIVQARQVEVANTGLVKLKVVGGKPAVETVYLNGQGPYRFLVDTGAEPNVVDAKLARKLGIEARFTTKMLTPAGMTAAGCAKVGRATLGPAEATDQLFLVTRLDYQPWAGAHSIRGILGQSFLSQFDYTIDFEKRELVFGKAVTSRSPVPFRRIHNLIAIATSEGDLVLDSGIGTLLLFRASAAVGRTVEIRASSGLTAKVSLDSAPELRIGGQIYHPGTAAFEPREGQIANGLLPASLFRAVFVCNSAGYVVIDP